MRVIYFVLYLLVCHLFTPASVAAQETPPAGYQLTEPAHQIVPVRGGHLAPRDGLLIDADDLLQIRAEYERMRYLLTRTTERDAEVCGVRVQIEQARTAACGERVSLRDELWTQRQTELVMQLREARQAAQQAGERSFWEHPALWFAVGVVATGLVWIAATVR